MRVLTPNGYTISDFRFDVSSNYRWISQLYCSQDADEQLVQVAMTRIQRTAGGTAVHTSMCSETGAPEHSPLPAFLSP